MAEDRNRGAARVVLPKEGGRGRRWAIDQGTTAARRAAVVPFPGRGIGQPNRPAVDVFRISSSLDQMSSPVSMFTQFNTNW